MRVLHEGVAAAPHEAERLRLAVEAIGAGTWYLDLATGSAVTDERFAEITGIGPGPVPDGRDRFVELFYGGDRSAFETRIREAADSGGIHVLHRIEDGRGAVHWIEGWARPVFSPDGERSEQPAGMIAVLLDVSDRRSAELERAEQGVWIGRLQDVTAGLAATKDLGEVIAVLTRLVPVAVEARHMTLRLVSEDGGALLPVGAISLRGDIELKAMPIEGDMPITRAVRTAEPVFDETIHDVVARMPEFAEQARAIGAEDMDLAVAIPLRSPQRVIGVMALTVPASSPLGPNAREFLLSVADQAAQVVERARAFEAEGEARAEAEEARVRLEVLLEVTGALSGALDPDEALRRLAELAVPRFGDWCLIEMREEGGVMRNVARVSADRSRSGWISDFRAEFEPVGTYYESVLASGEPLLIADIPDEELRSIASSDEHLSALRTLDPRSAIVVPLFVHGEAVGIFNLIASRGSGRRFDEEDVALAQEFARRGSLALENAMLHSSERAARRDAERFAEGVLRLQRVTAALSGAVQRDEVARAILGEGTRALGADRGALYTCEADALRLLSQVGYPEGTLGNDRILRTEVPRSEAADRPSLLRLASERKTLIKIPSPEAVEREWPSLSEGWRRLGDAAGVLVPLLFEDEVLGVLYLGFSAERAFDDDDTTFLTTLGRQCAQALERARLYEDEQRRVAAEEAARERLERLHAITETALANVRLEDGLQQMLEIVVDAADADLGAVVLLDEDSREYRLRAVVDDGADIRLDVPVDPQGTVLQAVLAGERVRAEGLSEIAIPPHARGAVGSILALPLRSSGAMFGWLQVASRSSAPRDGDADLVRLAAEQIGVAVDRSRLFEREHRIAETLQRSLLPERLPELPGLDMAARYLPGSGDAQVGGDWFEVVELPDGRIAAAVGDVVGSGVRAAAAMGQFRNAMRALALEGLGSARLLERLGDLAIGLGREFATAFTVLLDPTSGMIRYSSAGHPPALVLRADGTSAFLDAAGSTPLGVEPGTAYPEAAYALEEGDTVLLYTDGLIERRGESLDLGLERLRSVARAQASVESLVAGLITDLAPTGRRDDDIAVLALRFIARPLRFELSLPPVPASVAAFRSAFTSWLEEAGITGPDALDLTLAVSEACSNAVEHAGETSSEVELVAELRADDAMLAVSDGGRWRPPSLRPERGRGFTILRQVMDSIEVRRRPGGTEVRMHRRVGVKP